MAKMNKAISVMVVLLEGYISFTFLG